MGYFLVVIEQFLARLSGPAFASISARVAALTSGAAAKTVPALLNSIKSFIGNNAGKLNMVVSVLAGAGMSIDWSKVEKEAPALIPYMDNMKAVANEAMATLRQDNTAARHLHTGNAKDDGGLIVDSDLAEAIAAEKLIRRAALAVGSVSGLQIIREVVFMDETKFMKGMALIKR
jgi:hypothetical protein